MAGPMRNSAVPEEVLEHFQNKLGKRGADAFADWSDRFDAYCAEYPTEAQELKTMFAGELPGGWEASLPTFDADAKGMATRVSSGKVLNAVAAAIPILYRRFGGPGRIKQIEQ